MKRTSGPFYIPGKYANYVEVSEDTIQIKDPLDNKVHILYKSE